MNNPNKYPISSKAIIYKAELEYISKCVLDYPNIETGGDLFGFWTYSGYPVVQYVIGPGRNANHQVAFFNQELDYLNNIGNALRAKHGLQHIGEWHSHHKLGLAEPSGHDITTVTRAIDNYNLGKFFLVIANISEDSTGINGFMFKKEQGRTFDYTGWVVLDNSSPIRNSFDAEFSDMIYAPETKKESIIGLVKSSLDDTQYIKPTYTSDYWLNTPSNQLLFKNMIEALSEKLTEVVPFQDTENNTIYLQIQHKDNRYQIIFETNFPLTRPSIKKITAEVATPLNTSKVKWDPKNDPSTATVNFAYKVLGIPQGMWSKMFIKFP